MAIVLEKQRPTLQPLGKDASRKVKFLLPNPGDVFMVVAFAWATVCFSLVVFGDTLTRRIARLSGSAIIRDLLLIDQEIIAIVMITGLVGLSAAFYLFNRFRWITFGVFMFTVATANVKWQVLHYFSFAAKYLIVIYMATFGFLFFIKNGWRMIDNKFYRLYVLYVGWIAFIVALNGFGLSDLFYLGTEFTLMIGLGTAWLMSMENRADLITFNKVIAYTAIPVTILNIISPLVVPDVFAAGRFISMFGRATGFSTIYSVFVVALFWLSMYEVRPNWRRIFTAFALIGFGMILLSGTRNATVSTLIGVAALWWVFRTRIFVYLVVIAIAGLLGQILLAGSEDVAMIADRLQSTKNDRLGAWELYIQLTLESPLVGYGYEGLSRAVYGSSVVDIVSLYRRINVPGVHNAYIGFGVRWGLIGLALFASILFFAARAAWKVIFNRDVDIEDKKAYILPTALLLLIALQGIFEDTMGSTGKGSLHGIIFGTCPLILFLYSDRFLRKTQQQPATAGSTPVASGPAI